MRLFLAFGLPGPAARAIAGLRRDLPGWRWVPQENLHLTLVFLGDVDRPQAEDLDERLNAMTLRPTEITLEGIGHFGSKRPRAVWVGVRTNPMLKDLAQDLTRAARASGITVEHRRFVPHVTLARLPVMVTGEEVAAFANANATFSLPSFTPASVTLYRSHLRPEGPIYEPLADYPEVWP